VLVALGLGLTAVAGPLYGYADRAAADLLNVGHYVGSVLPRGIR
jgi:multicomponent Na+:H+ antiporter subunit D